MLYREEKWRPSVFKGAQGYCYIPYEYLTNPNLCFDVWTIRQIATDDFGREHWDNSDRINYLQSNANHFLNYSYAEDRSRVIEAVNEDDDDDTMSDGQWDDTRYKYQTDEGSSLYCSMNSWFSRFFFELQTALPMMIIFTENIVNHTQVI